MPSGVRPSLNLELFILLGLAFGPLAGLMGFIITYEEYSHHHLERRKLMVLCLQSAVTAFAAVLGILIVAGVVLSIM